VSKVDDIHKAILARAAQPMPARSSAAVGARPYVAEAGHRLAEGLREENQRLKAERESGLLVLRLDPKRVRATKFINRDERSFLESDPRFISLRESIRAHGQDTPIRVRPLVGDDDADYEVVFGHRRHRACLSLDAEMDGGFQVLALLDSTVSAARDFVLKMYRENEEREEQCAYDNGRSFRTWLAEGIFADQSEIARAIGVSDATVTKYLQIAELPESVIAAFDDPRDISVRWSHELVKAIKTSPVRVEETALRIANTHPRPAAVTIARTLISSANALQDERSSTSREQVSKIDGRVVLRQKRRDGHLSLKFYRLDKKAQRELTEELWEVAERWIRERLKGSPS
jgi:ParB family chromosome partitioning protein